MIKKPSKAALKKIAARKFFAKYLKYIELNHELPTTNEFWNITIRFIRTLRGENRGLNPSYLKHLDWFQTEIFELIKKYQLEDDWDFIYKYYGTKKCWGDDGTCETEPSYCHPKWKKWKYSCEKHINGERIRYNRGVCDQCGKPACWGPIGEKTMTRCNLCKDDNMENKIHRIRNCVVCGKPGAVYGFAEKTHCKNCRTPKMRNIKHPECCEDGCNTQASYGAPNTNTVIYCRNHGEKHGMVRVTHINK